MDAGCWATVEIEGVIAVEKASVVLHWRLVQRVSQTWQDVSPT